MTAEIRITGMYSNIHQRELDAKEICVTSSSPAISKKENVRSKKSSIILISSFL